VLEPGPTTGVAGHGPPVRRIVGAGAAVGLGEGDETGRRRRARIVGARSGRLKWRVELWRSDGPWLRSRRPGASTRCLFCLMHCARQLTLLLAVQLTSGAVSYAVLPDPWANRAWAVFCLSESWPAIDA
jgi:hypothetical protein